MKLTERELTTVIKALQQWAGAADKPALAEFYCIEGVMPLSREEVEALCRRLRDAQAA